MTQPSVPRSRRLAGVVTALVVPAGADAAPSPAPKASASGPKATERAASKVRPPRRAAPSTEPVVDATGRTIGSAGERRRR